MTAVKRSAAFKNRLAIHRHLRVAPGGEKNRPKSEEKAKKGRQKPGMKSEK